MPFPFKVNRSPLYHFIFHTCPLFVVIHPLFSTCFHIFLRLHFSTFRFWYLDRFDRFLEIVSFRFLFTFFLLLLLGVFWCIRSVQKFVSSLSGDVFFLLTCTFIRNVAKVTREILWLKKVTPCIYSFYNIVTTIFLLKQLAATNLENPF